MGNRATIQFQSKFKPAKGRAVTEKSPVIYVHWNGGIESVLSFAEAYAELFSRNDLEYLTARFIQMLCNWFGGELCVGTWPKYTEGNNVGDNGHFLFDVTTKDGKVQFELVGRHVEDYIDGKCVGRWRTPEEIALEVEEASKHGYMTPDEYGDTLKDHLVAATIEIMRREKAPLQALRNAQRDAKKAAAVVPSAPAAANAEPPVQAAVAA